MLFSDEFAKDKRFISNEKLIKNSDIIIIGAPHKKYNNLKFLKKNIVINIWDFLKLK